MIMEKRLLASSVAIVCLCTPILLSLQSAGIIGHAKDRAVFSIKPNGGARRVCTFLNLYQNICVLSQAGSREAAGSISM